MRSSPLTICLLTAALFVVGLPPLSAQETAEKPPSLLRQLFPEPTGANGYEEIAMACDLLRESKPLQAAGKKATLPDKRRALSDPDCARALLLLRQGLAKPRQPGRVQNAGLGAIVPLTALTHLLTVEQYVLMADGRTGAALDSLHDGLRLGYLAKAEGMFGSGLMGEDGFLLDYILLMAFAKHLSQLSARDCDRLIQMVNDYLASPDTTLILLERTRLRRMEQVAELRQDPQIPLLSAWLTGFEGGRGVSPETTALRKDLEALKEDPAAREALAAEMTQHINGYFDAEEARLRSTPRTPAPSLPPMATRAGRFAHMLLTNQSRTLDMLSGYRVQVQLLGVHAALRRFHWEHNRLPTTLAEMNMKKLTVDPFTGKEFGYTQTGMLAYELSSGAPMKTALEASFMKAMSQAGISR